MSVRVRVSVVGSEVAGLHHALRAGKVSSL